MGNSHVGAINGPVLNPLTCGTDWMFFIPSWPHRYVTHGANSDPRSSDLNATCSWKTLIIICQCYHDNKQLLHHSLEAPGTFWQLDWASVKDKETNQRQKQIHTRGCLFQTHPHSFSKYYLHFSNMECLFCLSAYRAPFRGFFTLTGILILGEILVQWWHLWAGGLVCMTICVYNTTNVRQAAKLGQCSAHSSCLAKKQNAAMKQINNPCL